MYVPILSIGRKRQGGLWWQFHTQMHSIGMVRFMNFNCIFPRINC
jgi:hypothetical protein